MKHSLLIFTVLCVVYALAITLTQNSYYQLVLALTLIWTCMALSWNLISGYSGLLSFGHAIFFGLGAYATILAQVKFSISPWIMLPVSGIIGALAGVIVGLATFRLRGHYFAFAMLAYPLAVENIFEWLGYQEVTFPRLTEGAVWHMQFSNPRSYSIIALILLVVCWGVSTAIEHSRFGASLAAIKQNELAAQASGVHTLKWKFYAIAVSGAMGAVAGSLYSVVMLIVTPNSVFGMLVSAQALTLAVFGGIGTVWGPIIGAAVLVPLGEYLQAQFGSVLPGIQGVLLGAAIVVVVLAAPEGIFWAVRDAYSRWRTPMRPASDAGTSVGTGEPSTPIAPVVAKPMPLSEDVILDIHGLSRQFGGVQAVSDVSFQVHRGEILGIIGPNGAGKTTLFNLLNGFVMPDAGKVAFGGSDITRLPPHRRCALGIGRTFQVVRPFRRLSVLENVKLGSYLHNSTEQQATQCAMEALERLGLKSILMREAMTLNNRELRLMELARAMAGRPALLLLDETLAGLRVDDSEVILSAIRELARSGVTVVIIEHTMQAMIKLVDEFLVLDRGRVLCRGSVDEVTRNEAVIEAYLGSKWRVKSDERRTASAV